MDRLAESFGKDSIRSMTLRFAVMLDEAIEALAAGRAETIAHRVAGVAGTLGFAEVGRAWLAVAEGDESAIDEARRHAIDARMLIAGRWN